MSVYKMIPQSGTIYDIGTDHAHLPIFLAGKNICGKIVGSDINKGPLLAAKKNIRGEGLSDEVELRQGSGFDPIYPGSEDTVIITGMGGKAITDILEKGKEKAKKCKCVIIQPNYIIELVRDWAEKNGFIIIDEMLCKEAGRIYAIIKTAYNNENPSTNRDVRHNDRNNPGYLTDDVYKYIGKKLIEKKDPLLPEYIERNKKIINHIICEIKENANADRNVKVRQLDMLCGLYENMEDIARKL